MVRYERLAEGGGGRDTWPVAIVCLFCLLLLFMPTVAAAQPSGYQEYYVLGYEEQVWKMFLAIYEGSPEDIPGKLCSTVSIVATADRQVIFYDHWEDGYEPNLLNPGQESTEVFGDEDPANGGTANDILFAGDAINLTSDQDVTGVGAKSGYVPVSPARDPRYLRYDGRDRIISSGGPVNLTHAMWPLNRSWIGGAWEVYSQQTYGESFSYRIPIGVDLYDFGQSDGGNAYGDFRDIYLQLGAYEDNTTVLIENGTNSVNLTLDRGWLYSSMGYVNSSSAPSITIKSGTIIRTNKPTQVGLATGASSPGGAGFQGRFFALLPDQMWGADYVVPVPSGSFGDEAEVYLANPNDFPISVNAYDAEIQRTFSISPVTNISATVPYSKYREGLGYVPQDSAARFTSSDGVFGVLVAADTTHTSYDWGFSGIPVKHLTKDYYVSWAPGTTDLSDNGSPIWVTPVSDGTTFYVDFSPIDGIVDEIFTLDVLQQRRVFDRRDNDNTGTHVWATSKFAMVWGEDPATAGSSVPYLDLGVATLPLVQRWLDPVLVLDKTANPTTLAPVGGTVTFTLVAHSQKSPLHNLDLTDTLPIGWSYVPGSTMIAFPDGSTGGQEPVTIDQTLFWDLAADLDVSQKLTLEFQAQITDTGGVELTAFDGFESNDYGGGANWVGDWRESGDDGNPVTGGVRIVTSGFSFSGSSHLEIVSAAKSISRTVNLKAFVQPTLRFARRIDGLESGDSFYLDVYDGIHWTRVLTWTAQDLEGDYVSEIIDLTPYASTGTSIRFRSGASVEADDFLRVDQVKVYEGVGIGVNEGLVVGQDEQDEYSDTILSASDEATVYISPLSLVKSASHTEARIGDTLVYTLAYINLSTSVTATNVTLRDIVPDESLSFRSASEGGVFDAVSGSIIWSLDTLSPKASGIVTFSVKVSNFAEDGTILKNMGWLESDQTLAGSNEVQTMVLAPRVEFFKSGPDAAARGQVITYTLAYRNAGRSGITGAMILDDIPLFTDFVSDSLALNTGSGWIALSDVADGDQGAYISPTLIITPGVNAGTIAAGEAGQIRFNVRVDDELPPSSRIFNSATLDRDLDIPRESNTLVTRISDLLLEKAAEQGVTSPGGMISYTLAYRNASRAISQTNIYVQELIPSFTRFIPGTAYGADLIEYSWDNGTTWSTSIPITSVSHIRWYDGILPAGAQELIGFAVTVEAVLPPNSSIQNIAHITSTETAALFNEWIPSNETAVETVDLFVDKYVSSASALAGGPLTYTIVYGNRGSIDASGVRITDMIPVNATYRQGSITGTGADDSGDRLLAWDILTVTAGASTEEASYVVDLDSDLLSGAVVTNTVTLTSPYGVVTSKPVTTTVTGPSGPVLLLSKEASAYAIVPGEHLTYSVHVVNNGQEARGLVISDVVPSNTRFVTCGGAACGLYGNTVVWGPLNLAGMGTTQDLELVVKVAEGLTDNWPIVNADYWLVAENAPPLIGMPVTSTVNVAELSISKWAFRDEVFAGSRLDYGVEVRNTGSRAIRLVVSDTLPADTAFGGCDCTVTGFADALDVTASRDGFCGAPYTCGLDGNNVVWQVDEVQSSRTLRMTFWVTVSGSLSEGVYIVNDTYAASADHVQPVFGDQRVTTTVRSFLVSITKEAAPNPVAVSQQLLFTITVRNNGSLLKNVEITDLLPSGVSYVSCAPRRLPQRWCEPIEGEQREILWWLADLDTGREENLTVRVLVDSAPSNPLVNEFYGLRVIDGVGNRRVMGSPLAVQVIYRVFLPVLLLDFAP